MALWQTANQKIALAFNGKVHSGEMPPCLNAVLAGYQPPSCYFYAAASGYLQWGPVSVDGTYLAGVASGADCAKLRFDVDDPAADADIYTDSGCSILDGPAAGGFMVPFKISRSGAVYTVTAVWFGVTVFSGSGALGAAIATSVGSGTITLSCP